MKIDSADKDLLQHVLYYLLSNGKLLSVLTILEKGIGGSVGSDLVSFQISPLNRLLKEVEDKTLSTTDKYFTQTIAMISGVAKECIKKIGSNHDYNFDFNETSGLWQDIFQHLLDFSYWKNTLERITNPRDMLVYAAASVLVKNDFETFSVIAFSNGGLDADIADDMNMDTTYANNFRKDLLMYLES